MIFVGVAAIFALQLVANETSGGPKGPCVTHHTAPLGPEGDGLPLQLGKRVSGRVARGIISL